MKKPQSHKSVPTASADKYIGPESYFVIQNIATGKLRLYEARSGGLPHKLILETDMIAGYDSKDSRSILGQFEIHHWVKFYEDEHALYPSFFNPRYPPLPGPGAPLSAWLLESLLPQKSARLRGLHGWYTGALVPNAGGQSLNGTWGWGADGDKIIHTLRSPKWSDGVRVVNRGSHVENRAIALLRELLLPGAKVITIYAREGYLRSEVEVRARGAVGSWPWALTAEGVNEIDGFRAGRASVEVRDVPAHMILDEGIYEFNQTPTAVPLTASKNRYLSGNVYRLPKSSFRGVFLVDAGRLMAYEHPKELAVGGIKGPLPTRFSAAKVKIHLPVVDGE